MLLFSVLGITVLAAGGSVDGSSGALNTPLPCCTDATLEFNPRCETVFSHNDMPFAWFLDERPNCSAPCLEMKDGLMKMRGCLNVTANAVCTDNNGRIDLEDIHYIPEKHCAALISSSTERGHYWWVVLLLWAAVSAAL
ncbi:hypothetical protein PBY51_017140 [Eleginops maclovinus]|uniref:Uncharacterized protein n=1 Tax=Eleginops maclovinus TaxID=56733 RepID=A0AAN8ANT1_ELEMC|nr:hypothetical protein PBY51_017140 [Eleginops maclovinus]